MKFSELHPPAIQKSLVMLQCSNPDCRAETHAACNCGVAYNPKEIAKQAIIADPSKSDRTIAKETGASRAMVQRVRHELGGSGEPPERKGADGKTYRAQIAATEARKEKRHEIKGWLGFERRVYQALEYLRMEIPDLFNNEEPRRLGRR